MPWNVWNSDSERWENLKSFRSRTLAKEFLEDVVLAEKREGTFEVRRVEAVLESHGTQLMNLKPSMIWQCAMADLERRERNKERSDSYEVYAFHRRHVAKATSANDIIRAALATPHYGKETGKKDTRLLYSDLTLLEAALQ